MDRRAHHRHHARPRREPRALLPAADHHHAVLLPLHHRQAWVAAMLALAHDDELSERPALAVTAAENALDGTDTADWGHI